MQDGYVIVKYETFTPVTGNDIEVNSIAREALSNQLFTSVRFTKNITLEDLSFQNCTSLRDVYFEEDIEFTSDVFKGCTALFRINTDGAQYIYNSVDNTPYFLQSLLNVTSNSVSILQGTKYIGSDYSSVNSSIQSIYFPSSVKKFTDIYPYYNWTNLRTLDFSDTQIEELPGTVLSSIKNLTNLYLPYCIKVCGVSLHNFTSLKTYTYNYGKYLTHRDGTLLALVGLTSTSATSLTLVNTCRCTTDLTPNTSSYGTSTKNTSLRTITLNEGLERIGSNTFGYCTALTTINWSSTIKEIGDYAFYHCNSLRNVTFPNGLEKIGNSVFGYYESSVARTFNIPASVNKIGTGFAFWTIATAPSIYINIDSNNPVYTDNGSNVIYDKTNDTLLFLPDNGRMPDTTRVIQRDASDLWGMKNEIYLPESIEYIADRAFDTGKPMPANHDGVLRLPNITFLGSLPSKTINVFGPNLATITSNSIVDSGIEALYFESTTPPDLQGEVNYYNIGNAIIYVPYGCLNAYKTAPVWSDWSSRIQEGTYQGE